MSLRHVGASLQSSILSPLTLPSPPGGERVLRHVAVNFQSLIIAPLEP